MHVHERLHVRMRVIPKYTLQYPIVYMHAHVRLHVRQRKAKREPAMAILSHSQAEEDPST